MNEVGDELFSRWMAHREGAPDPEGVGAHPDALTPSAPVVPLGPIVPPLPTAPAFELADDPMAPVAPPVPVELPPAPVEPRSAPVEPPPTAAAAVPRDYTFRPRRATRTTLTTALLGWVLASVAMGLVAYQDRSSTSYSIVGLVVLLTVITWAVRAGTTVARLRVVGGMLRIRRGGRTDVFSLIDSYQRIDVVGRPGGLTWQVRFERHGAEPYVVDGSMVQPKEFMRVLAYYRPGLGTS